MQKPDGGAGLRYEVSGFRLQSGEPSLYPVTFTILRHNLIPYTLYHTPSLKIAAVFMNLLLNDVTLSTRPLF